MIAQVDRKNNYYFIRDLRFPFPKFTQDGNIIQDDAREDKFFKDTMLDGEIVLDTLEDGSQQLRFLVFDVLVVDSKKLLNRDLSRRLGVLTSPSTRWLMVTVLYRMDLDAV